MHSLNRNSPTGKLKPRCKFGVRLLSHLFFPLNEDTGKKVFICSVHTVLNAKELQLTSGRGPSELQQQKSGAAIMRRFYVIFYRTVLSLLQVVANRSGSFT